MSYKRWVLAAILLFVIGLAFGVITPASLTPEAFAAFREFGDILTPLSPALLAIIIFTKNASVLLFSFALSPILCLMPILALTVNGWMLAAVSTIVAEEQSLGWVLAALLPHGVIEIPAIILGEAAALSFGAIAIILVLKKENRTILMSTVKKDVGHVLLVLALFFTVGIFYAIIIVGLLEKQTRDLIMVNVIQNLKYLMIALALLLPAAIIEAYVTPLFLR